jgi:ABC-type bacteriocin/lantibiotic exporter with double-glycine peptidase domain
MSNNEIINAVNGLIDEARRAEDKIHILEGRFYKYIFYLMALFCLEMLLFTICSHLKLWAMICFPTALFLFSTFLFVRNIITLSERKTENRQHLTDLMVKINELRNRISKDEPEADWQVMLIKLRLNNINLT